MHESQTDTTPEASLRRSVKLLIVDDDPLVHGMIQTSLSHRGFVMRDAYNGLEALEQCKAQWPDVIVLDAKMPEMDGLTFLTHLKQEASTSGILLPPMILLTAHEDMVNVFETEGINDYLIKPIDIKLLEKKILSHIISPVKTILLVEDEDDLRQIIQQRLEKSGYHVLTAADGLEGVQLLQKHTFDCSILDVMLPKMSGFHICRMIKFNRRYQDCAVILLTALAGEDITQISKKVKADACLFKPFNPPALLDTLKTLLWD